MARRRLVVELGRGTDLRGRDYTKAAVRALSDALRRNSLTVVPALGYPREAMEVEVTIGVARPEAVDREAVAAVVPYGRVTVDVVRGGLDVAADEGDGVTVIANASVVVWLDVDVSTDEKTADETIADETAAGGTDAGGKAGDETVGAVDGGAAEARPPGEPTRASSTRGETRS